MDIKCKKIIINDKEFFVPVKNVDDIFTFVLLLNNGVIEPKLAFTSESFTEDYDYDYDENLYIRGVETCVTYYPISYNPFDGKRIGFYICSIEDRTLEYNDILKLEKENSKKRKSKNKLLLEVEYLNKKENIIKDIPILFSSGNISYTDGDSLSIIDFIDSSVE